MASSSTTAEPEAAGQATPRVAVPVLKLAVVGCGKFARRYHLPAIEGAPSLQLSVVCDVAIGPEIADAALRLGARTTTRIR